MIRSLFNTLLGKEPTPTSSASAAAASSAPSLPVNFLRTAFGLNASPYENVSLENAGFHLLNLRNRIFDENSLKGLPDIRDIDVTRGNPVIRPVISAVSTYSASALGMEFMKPRFLSENETGVFFAINNAAIHDCYMLATPVCFLFSGSYKDGRLAIDKLVIPDQHRSEAYGDWKYKTLPLTAEMVDRAMFYADKCMDNLASGQHIEVQPNLQAAGLASAEELKAKIEEMRFPRQFGRDKTPSNDLV